jgi:hypothetical protein
MGRAILIILRLAGPLLRRSRRLELAAAICVAGLVDLREKWDGLRAALKTKQEVSDELRGERLEICRSCRLFDPLMSTCGSALKDYGKPPAMKAGCHCCMTVAAGTLHNCWLFDQGELTDLEDGWPTRLNSFT